MNEWLTPRLISTSEKQGRFDEDEKYLFNPTLVEHSDLSGVKEIIRLRRNDRLTQATNSLSLATNYKLRNAMSPPLTMWLGEQDRMTPKTLRAMDCYI